MPRTKTTVNGKYVEEEGKTDPKTGKVVKAPAKPKVQNNNQTAAREQLYDERDEVRSSMAVIGANNWELYRANPIDSYFTPTDRFVQKWQQ